MEEQTSIKKIMNEIEQLDYADRIRLVESIMRTLRVRESVSRERKKGGDPEAVFGLWKDRDITLNSIRAKAWQRQ